MSDPLSITASIIAILQLASTATDYLRGIKSGATDRVKLRDELRNTTYLLEMLRDHIEDAEDIAATPGTNISMAIKSLSGPDNPLIRFQRMLEDIMAQLTPKDKLSRRSLPLTWPFVKRDIAEKLACLERLKSHFNLVMQNDLLHIAQSSNRISQSSHNILIDMGQKLDDNHSEHQNDQNQRAILWLSTLAFRQQHVAILESVQEGTGTWFIKHKSLQNWLEGKIDMLWCPGLPGAGKSRLMSIVVDTLEHVQTADTIFTYIYCDYSQREEQTPAALLSSLLGQVLQCCTSETIPAEVMLLYNSHKKYGTRPTSKELLELLAKLTSIYRTFFIVMDALDECSESEEDTIRFLSTLRSMASNVKILCSSRLSTTFESYFVSTEKIEIFARDEDIKMVLSSGISQHHRLSKHVRCDPDLQPEIIAFITSECQGMFLLAKLHLEAISTKINRKAVRSALRTLPATLDDTYSDSLQRIRDQPSDIVELAEIVLAWVLCARQNLTVMQLQHMYAMQEVTDGMALEDDDLPDGETLTGACGGLITVDSESQTIHLIHYTAQQYFERCLGQQLLAARMSLTKVSLGYLVLPNFESGFCTSDTAMVQRLTEYPFLDYAAKHWGSEMNLLDADELLPDLERFLSNPIAVEMANQASSLSSARYSNWSQEFPRNSPALVIAAAFDLPVILRQMIANGHEIEGSGTDKETALIRAAAYGHVENVRVLLQLGAVVDAKDYLDETALQRAARMGNAGVTRVLIDEGASVNIAASSNWTPLMSAVSSGSIDTVCILVEAGAEVMAETEWGDSALCMALRSGNEAITVFLTDHGAILASGVAGRRASIIAARRGLQHVVRRLVIDYEAVAGQPLQRQTSRMMTGLPEDLGNTPREGVPDSQTEAQASEEVSFGELMEEYDIKNRYNQRYRSMQQLGKGHFATVYLCSNNVTGVVSAVKIFKTPNSLTSFEFQSMRNEIQLLRELQKYHHPSFTRLIDAFADFKDNIIYLVMNLAPEGELFHLIVEKQKFSENESRRILRQLLSAIQFLHDLGWVHRDIKPENILVMDQNLTIQLSDFGLAKQIHTDSTSNDLTSTLCGTPSYVAPEVLAQSPHRRYGFGVDIWSSGVVLYICLCGFPPFSDELYTKDSPYTLAQQIKMGKFDYPSPYWDPVGDPALDIIDRMLTVPPVKRLSAQRCLSHRWISSNPEEINRDQSTMENCP